MIVRYFSIPPAGWKNAGDAAPPPPPPGPADNVLSTPPNPEAVPIGPTPPMTREYKPKKQRCRTGSGAICSCGTSTARRKRNNPPSQAAHFHQTINGIAHDCGNMKSRRVAPGRNEQSCYTMDAMLIDLEDSDVKDGLSGVFPS